MSSATVKALPPLTRPLTSEASNVLGFWWLAIVTTLVLLASMWPSIFTDGSSMGNYLLFIISTVLIALGVWCTIGFVKAQSWSAGAMRLITMIGLGVGLAGVGYFLYSVAFAATPNNAPTFWGPSGVLAGVMWTLVILLPFIFGMTLIFGLMNEAIDDWFNPPTAVTVTRASLQIDPRTAALMAGAAGVSSQLGDDDLMGELDQAMNMTEDSAILGSDQSIEVIGSAEDDLSVEVISDQGDLDTDNDSMAELAALEEALTEDASKKIPAQKKKPEPKYEAGKGDEPLAVDDDFKL
jgi:hypothetical protein